MAGWSIKHDTVIAVILISTLEKFFALKWKISYFKDWNEIARFVHLLFSLLACFANLFLLFNNSLFIDGKWNRIWFLNYDFHPHEAICIMFQSVYPLFSSDIFLVLIKCMKLKIITLVFSTVVSIPENSILYLWLFDERNVFGCNFRIKVLQPVKLGSWYW